MQAGVVGTMEEDSLMIRHNDDDAPGRASLDKLGCRTPQQLHAEGVDRQQHDDLNPSTATHRRGRSTTT